MSRHSAPYPFQPVDNVINLRELNQLINNAEFLAAIVESPEKACEVASVKLGRKISMNSVSVSQPNQKHTS